MSSQSQNKPYMRALKLIALIAIASVLYLIGFDQQIQIIRHATPHIFVNSVEKDTNITKKEGFLIWNEKCQIPDINPFHESVRKFLKPAESIICSKFGPLTYISNPMRGPPYVLKVDSAIVYHYTGNQDYICCYSNVSRPLPNMKENKTADNKFIISNCSKFIKEVTLGPQTEFILVKCNILKNGSKGKEVYSNMHALVPIKVEINHKLQVKHKKQKPSVLLIGIDSVSRLNLKRTMPKTSSYLQHKGWTELKGYNKVGDNTLPNILAILTGQNVEEARKSCWHKNDGEFDECPFLWKEFSKQGYVTLYGEDGTAMSTFNYHKNGFINPPTDYYLRPFFLAAEKKLKLKSRDTMYVCLGPTSTTEHLLQYAVNFASTFRNSLYFALLWINNISHNNLNTLATMDYRFLKFFNDLEQIGTLDSTIIIFFSDHGIRFGKIRETLIGWYEERLPFIQIWVPLWFRKIHKEAFTNILANQNHLTSPYDLHLTLKDILMQNRNSELTKNSSQDELTFAGNVSCPKCMSLFEEVPDTRSCSDAGITSHWCVCDQYEVLNTKNEKVQKTAQFVTSEINKRLEMTINRTQNSTKCAELTVKKVLNIRLKLRKDPKYEEFVIQIETKPGNSLYEASVQLSKKDHVFSILGPISRINMYWSQSKCINDSILKLYCYCVNS